MDNYYPYFNIAELIAKQLQGELTDEEKNELEQWLQADPRNRELFKKLSDRSLTDQQLEIYSSAEKEKAWKNIVKKTGFKEKTKKRSSKYLQYAAAVLLLLGVSLTINQLLNKKQERRSLAVRPKDILPGGNKAVLILANGSKIVLDDSKHGKIAEQQNVSINQTQNGQIVYNIDNLETAAPAAKSVNGDALAFNTIVTPRGGQFQVVLPDGTKVWLNAASSLKYPTAFTGNDRRVELTGEAYFEVAKNAAKPFFVKTNIQTVEVLGTHFNINSYTDEKAIKTTLLEGSVKVTCNANKQTVKLSPGEQSVNITGQLSVIPDADTDEAIAWKNGKFLFRNADLQSIMRQLSRWYDVDVEYQGSVITKHYKGRISRNVPVSQVFQILKTSGINFTIDGRKIIVKS